MDNPSLHYETVSPLLKNCLQTISRDPLFKDFVLIGGTCLSLQIGHRRSLDIDLFTDICYGTMNTRGIKEYLKDKFPYSENLDVFDQTALGYSVRVGESVHEVIKLDFFYTEKFIFPLIDIDGIRMADIREIAAMKMQAISQSLPRQKDFWDINELNGKYSFKEMIDWGIKRNPYALCEKDILNGFSKIDDVLECPEGIDCLRGNYWEIVKDDLKGLVSEYVKGK